MADGNTFVLKDHYTYLDEPMTNVYYYLQTDGDEGAETLAQQWVEDILPLIREVQHTGCVHSSVEAFNMQDPEDFHVEVLTSNNAGLMTGEKMPRFNAWGFRKNRASRTNRHGAIRLGGLAEGAQDGGIPGSAVLEDLGTLAAAYGQDLVALSGDTWEMSIPVGGFGGGFVPLAAEISSVEFVRITTQNSRKR